MARQTGPDFPRFSRAQRVEHVVLFTTFIVLAVTGLPQKWPQAGWAQGLIAALGGIQTVRLIHREAAAVMLAGFAYHVCWALYTIVVQRRQCIMLPTWKDVQDVWANLRYFVGLRPQPPLFDKFTYKEKFDYWAVFWGVAVMAGSGLVLWFPTLTTRWLPGVVVPISKAAHSDEALLAVLAIVLWHLYNVHFNPEIFPFNPTIFTGRISAQQQRREHPLEYARLTGQPPEELPRTRHALKGRNIALSGLLGAALVSLMVGMMATGFAAAAPAVEVRPTRAPIVRFEPTPLPPTPTPQPTATPEPAVQATVTAAAVAGVPGPAVPAATRAVSGPRTTGLGKDVTHLVAGRETCSGCHVVGPPVPLGLPVSHAGRQDTTCLACHAAPRG